MNKVVAQLMALHLFFGSLFVFETFLLAQVGFCCSQRSGQPTQLQGQPTALQRAWLLPRRYLVHKCVGVLPLLFFSLPQGLRSQDRIMHSVTYLLLIFYLSAQEEAEFWARLPAALSQGPASHRQPPGPGVGGPAQQSPLSDALWDAAAEVAHCEERVHWHEAMRLPHDDPQIQVRWNRDRGWANKKWKIV